MAWNFIVASSLSLGCLSGCHFFASSLKAFLASAFDAPANLCKLSDLQSGVAKRIDVIFLGDRIDTDNFPPWQKTHRLALHSEWPYQ